MRIEPVILDMDHVVYLTDALLFDENPELLTILQKKVKAHLLSGKVLGNGWGILRK